MSQFRWLKKPEGEGKIETKFEKRLKLIIKTIEEGEGASAEEVLICLEQIIPPKVIIQEVEPKSSPEQLQYLKDYRKFKKWLKEIKDKDMQEQEKIKKALEREKAYCFSCKSVQPVLNPSYEIIKKRNRQKKNIIVSFECSNCGKNCKYFGGNL